jgi:hypothetical protein
MRLRTSVNLLRCVYRRDTAAHRERKHLREACPSSADSIISQLKEDDVTANTKKMSNLRAVEKTALCQAVSQATKDGSS